MFGCLPSELEGEDWDQLHQILEYRAADRAIELMQSPDKGRAMDAFAENPHLAEAIVLMKRAQAGLPLTGVGVDLTREAGQVTQGLQQAAQQDEDPDTDEDGDQ